MKTIDLDSKQGNIFYIIGIAIQVCEELDIDFEPIVKEMSDGDRYHAVKFIQDHEILSKHIQFERYELPGQEEKGE